MAKYRTVAILTARFNELYGMRIEQIKTTFTIFTVVCTFVTVRHYDQISLYFFLFCANVLIFTYTLPPLLYYEAYKVHENSARCKRMLTRELAERCVRMWLSQQRKVLRSLRPLEVRVAGMYFLDRMMVPLYLQIIFSYTCTALLSY